MQVKWYRNAAEKGQDKPVGQGEMLELNHLAGMPECIAVIVDAKGDFYEKTLSLVRAVVETPKKVVETPKPKPVSKGKSENKSK